MEQDWREQDDSINTAQGTCGWLFEHESFRSWLSRPTSSILWILGHPGVGKSTLMNFVVRWKRKHLDENSKEVVAAFYVHARGKEIQHSPIGLYRSMLHQLLPYAPGQLATLTAEWLKRKAIRETFTWSEQKLRECFYSVVTRICEQLPVTLFVDALDELGKTHAVRFIEEFGAMVKALQDPGVELKICFSCRHYPNLYPDSNSYLYPGLPSESSLCVKVEEKNGDDIKKLISTHRALRRMDAEISTKTKEEVLQLILNRAKGIFQWVVLVLEQVGELLDYSPHPSRIKQEIEKIPAGLEALYDFILISSNSEPGQTLKLFRWLLFTVWPLSVAELRDALAIEAYMSHKSYSDIQSSRNYYVLEKMKQSVRILSKGLVQVKVHTDITEAPQYIVNSSGKRDPDYNVESQSVEFIHESVRDYLIEKGLYTLKTKLGLLPGTPQHSCQFQLSRSCIGYLSLNEINCPVDLYCSYNYMFVNATPNYHYALRDYARFFWIHHVMKTEQDHIDQQDLLAIFRFGNGTDSLPPIYVENHIMRASETPFDGPYYLDQMLQKDDELLSTMQHWKTFHDDLCLQFRQAWVDLRIHLSLPSILCLAGISSALRQMRILKPDLYRTSERGRLLMYALLGRNEQIIQDILKDLQKDAHLPMSPGLDFLIGGWSPLLLAVETEQEDLLQKLLDAGANPNLYYTNPVGLRTTCLLSAVERGRSNMVRSLLHAGADASVFSVVFGEEYRPPLHNAVGGGRLDMVKALLESGADPNIADGHDNTPLMVLMDHYALISGDDLGKIFRLLIDHGADPNHRRDQHRTILTTFIGGERFWKHLLIGHQGFLEFMLNNGAHPGIIDDVGISALEVNLLLSAHEIGVHKPLLDWTDDHGYTTLMCELMIRKSFGCEQVETFGDILEVLAGGGEYDFNVQAHDGNNLLSVAVIMGAAGIVDILLKYQTVDPNVQDINGHTPLMKAADYGHKEIVRLVLDCQRTAIGMVDRCGWTAFDWAVHAGNTAIATWLRNAMI